MSRFPDLQVSDLKQTLSQKQALFEHVRQFILDNFGPTGLYAVYLVGGATLLFLAIQLIRTAAAIAFGILLAAVVAYVLAHFMPYGFDKLFPVTAAVVVLGMILRMIGKG